MWKFWCDEWFGIKVAVKSKDISENVTGSACTRATKPKRKTSEIIFIRQASTACALLPYHKLHVFLSVLRVLSVFVVWVCLKELKSFLTRSVKVSKCSLFDPRLLQNLKRKQESFEHRAANKGTTSRKKSLQKLPLLSLCVYSEMLKQKRNPKPVSLQLRQHFKSFQLN